MDRWILPVTGLACALALAACGRDEAQQATPVPPPTEIAAIDTPPPQYPIELGCAGIGGQSVLQVEVGTEGVPTRVSLLRTSGNDDLDRLAQEAVQGWKFRPATRGGQPIARTIQVPVNFTPPQVRPDECFALDAGRRP
ncbi:energy transducer TonB [Pseudoxanthomonas suwonensis]|jgi:protein TonB|uniref:energy transducer TonB n=1 Tax=Pseudoxanthomonas suwonensis TaxID=314722 RepID=UPI00138EF0CF|nr:energy transducer TonB [Pseudoxanthomonas suwonensis]KAF1702031.1 energy transducer TonB [Pseudoxanthomonas suwonensis]